MTARPMDDRDFLTWFDLDRPSMAEARRLATTGDDHGAALAAAAAAGEGRFPGVIRTGNATGISDAIRRHTSDAFQLERQVAELWMRPEIPSDDELGYVDSLRLGNLARTGRRRGYETMILALLWATTGERRYADASITAALRLAATFDPTGGPPVNSWHPGAPDPAVHDVDVRLEYWMPVWGILDGLMQPEDRLTLLKAILPAARSLLHANRDDIAFNLTLHPTIAPLVVAAAFPALREGPAWLDELAGRMTTTYVNAPFATIDGYTREGTAYHAVNTRMLTWAHLVYESIGRPLPRLRQALEAAYRMQAMFIVPDGSGWMIGDGGRLSFHEPWVDAHESLHLGAALFDRPDWKMLAGSVTSTTPPLLTMWAMGAAGIERWAAMGPIDLDRRSFPDGHAPASCFHVLHAGTGLEAHAGILWFGSEMNHGHHDKGQVLLYGLGRHLLSDYGHPGYNHGDMSPGFSARVHGVAAIIRRTPMGPRTDFTDYSRHLAQLKTDTVSLAMAEHTYYENHVIRRALALISPHGAGDPGRDAFWLIWDSVQLKRGWPEGAPEAHEVIETNFPFHAPGCGALICDEGRSIISRYDGPNGAPYIADGPSRREQREAHEYADSDANLQVTRLATPGSPATWDARIQPGLTNTCGGPFVDRPMGLFRWRGRLAHHGGYVLVPFRGLRDTHYAAIDGSADDDGLTALVALPAGRVRVVLTGLKTARPSATVSRA